MENFNKNYKTFKENIIGEINRSGIPLPCVQDVLKLIIIEIENVLAQQEASNEQQKIRDTVREGSSTDTKE